MLVEYGCLTLGRSFFTTLTLRAGPGLQKDAVYVRACWRKMLEFLRSRFETVEFVKVVELTKARQPHLHLVLHLGKNTSTLSAACESRASYNDRWLARKCDCLEHRLSGAWRAITGDSFVVDVKEVAGANAVASYLAKYLAKGMVLSDHLKQLGFTRAWARSRGWPFDQIRMVQTERGWFHKAFTPANRLASGMQGTGTAAEWIANTKERGWARTGTDLALALQWEREARARYTLPAQIRRMMI